MDHDDDLHSKLMPYTDQIAESRAFLTRLWNLDNAERPGFMIGYAGPRVQGGQTSENILFVREGRGTFRDRLLDPLLYLHTQVKACLTTLTNRGDYVPVISPMIGIVAIPSALGCPVQWWEDDLPAARPVVDDPAKIAGLGKPDLDAGVMGMALEYTRIWVEKTGGRVPIGPADCQSPLDLAALVMGHNRYLEAMYTHPREVKRLLQLLTEIQIEFLSEQRRIVKNGGGEFVPTYNAPWMPDGMGINIAHDENVMISSAMHDEFAVPYLSQISEAFNGIFIHSCGRFAHQLESFAKVHRLRGLEFGASEAPFSPVLDAFNGKIVLSVRIGLHQELRFPSMSDFVRQVRSAARTNRGLFINCDITNGIVPEDWPVVDLEEIYRLVE